MKNRSHVYSARVLSGIHKMAEPQHADIGSCPKRQPRKPDDTYMHAMSSETLTPRQASEKMNAFIHDNINAFDNTGDFGALGRAMHAAMDFTSPVQGNGQGTFPP